MWHWLDTRGVPGGILTYWLGGLPVVATVTTVWHRVTERRHKERVAAIRSLGERSPL